MIALTSTNQQRKTAHGRIPKNKLVKE